MDLTDHLAIICKITDSEKELLTKPPRDTKRVKDIEQIRQEFKKMKNQKKGLSQKSILRVAFSETKHFHSYIFKFGNLDLKLKDKSV